MIDPDADAFPMNIVLALKDCFAAIDPDIPALTRPIQIGDPIQAWGIMASLWTPDNESFEFSGSTGFTGQTINQYIIGIQCFNQDMDKERGLQTAATMAGIARATLTRDPATRATLAALTSTEFGFTERFARLQVQGQRFLSNEIEKTFYHLSNLEVMIETEIQ